MRKPFTILLWLTSIAASAQSVGDFFSMPAESDTVALPSIEVSAARHTDRLNVTAPVQELRAGDILLRGISDISDAMRRLPGVTLRDYGGAGGMKTISVRGLGSQHTGVSFDGMPMSDIQSGQIDLSQFSLDNLSALTLNIGDDDNMNKSARSLSMATTLNISTKDISDQSLPKKLFSYIIKTGSFGLINTSVKISLNNKKNLGMTLTGDFQKAKNNYYFKLKNGNTTGIERRNNSDLTSGQISWNGTWKGSRSSIFKASIFSDISFQHLPGPVIYYNDINNERLHKGKLFGQLSYRYSGVRNLTLEGRLKYDFARTHYTDIKAIYPGGKLDNRYYQNEEYANVNASWSPLSPLTFALATDYWHNSFKSNNPGSPKRDSWLNAISIKWQQGRFTAIARGLFSLIYDKEAKLDNVNRVSKFSPSFGINFLPLESSLWSLRASFKKIMRMPTFNELYFDHYGTVNLQPENTTQYNFGTTWRKYTDGAFTSLEIKADGYYNEVTNKIVAIPYNMFLWTMTNLGKVHVIGADASLSMEIFLKKNWSIMLNTGYSYQRAATRSERNSADWNKQIPYTPLNSGNASITMLNPWLNIVINSVAYSSRYSTTLNVPSTRIAGFTEFGLSVFRDFKFKNIKWDIRADVSNILNKTYEIVARYPMPGRAFYISIGLTLD